MSVKMSWEDSSITWTGRDVDSLTDGQKLFLKDKIHEYARRLPVKAKVVMIEKENQNEPDAIALAKVNETLYFVGITVGWMVIMDLHYVKNSIIAQLWEDNRYINLD